MTTYDNVCLTFEFPGPISWIAHSIVHAHNHYFQLFVVERIVEFVFTIIRTVVAVHFRHVPGTKNVTEYRPGFTGCVCVRVYVCVCVRWPWGVDNNGKIRKKVGKKLTNLVSFVESSPIFCI